MAKHLPDPVSQYRAWAAQHYTPAEVEESVRKYCAGIALQIGMTPKGCLIDPTDPPGYNAGDTIGRNRDNTVPRSNP